MHNEFTFTHELSGLKDERSKYVTDHVRFFRDIVTEEFVRTFLNDRDVRFRFIDYTYHTINTVIQTEINNYLIENGNKPLFGNEHIFFVFKGGNIMNYFVESITEGEDGDILDAERIRDVNWSEYDVQNIVIDQTDDSGNKIESFGALMKFIKTKFKISDIDYSIIINAQNYARYNLIHGGVVKILADILKTIGNFFDNYFVNHEDFEHNKTERDVQSTSSEQDEVDPTYEDVIYELQNMKNLISHPYFEEIVRSVKSRNDDYIEQLRQKSPSIDDTIIKYVNELSTEDPIERVERILSDINNQPLDHLIVVMQYLQIVMYMKNTGVFVTNKKKISDAISKISDEIRKNMEKKRDNIIETNFYTTEKIESFKKSVVDTLNSSYDKNDNGIKKYEMYFTGLRLTEDEYEMKNNVQSDSIKITPRECMLVSSNNISTEQVRRKATTDSGIHYVTFNNIIYVRQPVPVCFDLMRIKFNVICDDVFEKNGKLSAMSIPSEFIDVSIPRWQDTGLKSFNDHSKAYNLTYEDDTTKVSVLSYDLEEICADLQYVLFEQNYFCPWLDRKYEKRLIRLIFMLCCLAYEKSLESNSSEELEKFLKIVQLADKMLSFINNDQLSTGDYPYDALKGFVAVSDDDLIKNEIRNIPVKTDHLYIFQLISINKTYERYNNLIKSILILCFILKTSNNEIFKFINKNRVRYNYVAYDDKDIDVIIAEYRKMFIDMVRIIVDIGAKSYHLLNLLWISQQNDTATSTARSSREEHASTGGGYMQLYLSNRENYMSLFKR